MDMDKDAQLSSFKQKKRPAPAAPQDEQTAPQPETPGALRSIWDGLKSGLWFGEQQSDPGKANFYSGEQWLKDWRRKQKGLPPVRRRWNRPSSNWLTRAVRPRSHKH